ncbi:MAG: Mu-like prophage major head subunit gpT family protein, partial [Reyranella sp.]|nr:Mu-like prophage major head subunit gpT family protein [Reyranella sp.]
AGMKPIRMRMESLEGTLFELPLRAPPRRVEARGAAGFTWWQLAHRSTAALDATSYAAAKAAAAALTNDEGEPLGVKFTHIVVGSSNVAAARTLFGKANLAGGESNIYFNDVAIIEAERLA